MLQRILLPTDGSALSARALGIGETLAHSQGAELVLVRAVEPPWWVGTDGNGYAGYTDADLYQQVEDAMNEDARVGLDQTAARFAERGLKARTIVLHGFAASALLSCEQDENPDLVVMATHGRTGLQRFAVGSVADRLVREGASPVLLVRSFSPEVSWMERALVPLDGSALAEQALPMVETLAGKPLRWVKLLKVVDAEAEINAANAYLAPIAVRMATAGLEVIPEVRVGEPAPLIEAEAQSVDLVVMATHGRGGLDRFRHGSVAERATRHVAAAVLLVRAHDTPEPAASLKPTATVRAGVRQVGKLSTPA